MATNISTPDEHTITVERGELYGRDRVTCTCGHHAEPTVADREARRHAAHHTRLFAEQLGLGGKVR